jgi:Lrp/AsnC family transcriptional regulator
MAQQAENISLDATDIRILKHLQEDASATVADIAKAAGISPTPCWRRIRRLREIGVIRATVALLDAEKLGFGFTAYAMVKLSAPNAGNMEKFERMLRAWPEVITCHRITGAVDYLLKVVTKDMHAYDEFLRHRLLEISLVSEVQSRIALSSVKDTTALPLSE